jgi:hypothetical protein
MSHSIEVRVTTSCQALTINYFLLVMQLQGKRGRNTVMPNVHAGSLQGMPSIRDTVAASPAKQAYHILHFGFVAAPVIAGLDKFFHLLVNWDQYLAPWIATLSPIGGHNLMLLVGVVEIIAGLIVAVKPRIGAWIVFAWLWGIIINLLSYPGFYDIALRDFGLSLGAAALARLSNEVA